MIRIKEGFKGQRLVTLPENLMSDCAADPLIGNLYIRKIGYFPHVKYHYVSKQQGVAYAMLIYCTEGVGWVNIDNQTMMVKSDEYIILPPHTPYAFWAAPLDHLLDSLLWTCGRRIHPPPCNTLSDRTRIGIAHPIQARPV